MDVNELYKPLKNWREMQEAVAKKDPRGFVKNYLESIPGSWALTKLLKNAAVAALKPAAGRAVSGALTDAFAWYSSPGFQLLRLPVKGVRSAALSTGNGVAGAGLAIAGSTAALLTAQYVGAKYLKQGITFGQLFKSLVQGKPTQAVRDRIKADPVKLNDYLTTYFIGPFGLGNQFQFLAQLLWGKSLPADTTERNVAAKEAN